MPTTCPKTTYRSVLSPWTSLRCTVCSHWHSNAHGDIFIRGGFIRIDGADTNPASFISLVPRENRPEVVFICSRRFQVARLQTNSLVSSTKVIESFRPSEANITIGGSLETPLKNEYGARLISPFALIDEIQPIGRGATMALKGSRESPWFLLLGSQNKALSVTPKERVGREGRRVSTSQATT